MRDKNGGLLPASGRLPIWVRANTTLNIQSLHEKLIELREFVDFYCPSILVLTEARGQHNTVVVNRISHEFPEYKLVQGKTTLERGGGASACLCTGVFLRAA